MGKQGAPQDKKPAGPPTENKAPPPAPSASKGGGVGAKIGCGAVGCKDKDVRHSFCEEHFRQFKFGLITKAGERVLDYEKKLEHYQNWLKAQRVA